jgi:hypothetical protein
MARSHPGQLSLFDDTIYLPPPLPAPIEDVEAVEDVAPAEADRLVLALLVGSKSAGSVVAAARQAAAQHEVDIPAEAGFSLFVSLLDFGAFDSLDAEEVEAIIEAGSTVEMRRFDVALSTLGNSDTGDLALFADQSGGLEAFADCLRGALRERGAPPPDADRNGPHLPLGLEHIDIGPISLDRPLRMPIREFALLRLAGDGHEVLRKWALAA